MATLKVTQVKSGIDRPQHQKRVLQSLGLGKLHRTVELESSDTVRGAIAKVAHLVRVDE